ncbi:MAG: hypothetical protein J2P57_23760 [Acidimicrobiaceae bacterium]|nr:hypothetical protein [Acidimicrobiaceae bacterium]
MSPDNDVYADRVLVACEMSGRVRDALRERGIDAWSCDTRSTLSRGHHLLGDVRDVLDYGWAGIIAFPPCTYLAVSGARWWAEREVEQQAAVALVLDIWDAPCPRVAIENPVGHLSRAWRKPDQIIHPWQFGHGETKATCLWLRGLPPLQPTNVVDGRKARIHHMSNSRRRSKERSITYQGIADAMAAQWGPLL